MTRVGDQTRIEGLMERMGGKREKEGEERMEGRR